MPLRPSLPASWLVEINAYVDDHDLWVGNTIRFATWEDADLYGRDCTARWRMCSRYRVLPSALPPNFTWPKNKSPYEDFFAS